MQFVPNFARPFHHFSLEPTPKNIPLTPCSLELTHKNISRTLYDIQNKSINHFSPNVPIYCQLLSIHCTDNTHLKAELTKILTQIYWLNVFILTHDCLIKKKYSNHPQSVCGYGFRDGVWGAGELRGAAGIDIIIMGPNPLDIINHNISFSCAWGRFVADVSDICLAKSTSHSLTVFFVGSVVYDQYE